MGPINEGSLIYILVRANKNATTNFYAQVLIDTDKVIAAGSASNYMFDGRDDKTSTDITTFYLYTYFQSSGDN